MQEFEEDFYAILGVEDSATPEEIRKAYLTLAKKLHPDRFPNDPEQRAVAQREFAQVTRAHEVIGDATRRQEYDALHSLSKVRSKAASEPIAAGPSTSPAAAEAESTISNQEARAQQAETIKDDQNINIKWANKHLVRADDLYRKQRYQEAETAMKEAIRLVPTDPKYRCKLAEIYLARGWKTLAMTEVQAALRIDPKDHDSKVMESKVKSQMKTQSSSQTKTKGGWLEQIKSLFAPKKR